MESSDDEVKSASNFSETESPVSKEQYNRDTFEGIDPACCKCDDGGIVHSCDGNCLRSFHFGLMAPQSEEDKSPGDEPEAGEEEYVFGHGCNPLDLPEDLAMHFQKQQAHFKCPNCLAQRQRCYSCNIMGDSDLNRPFSQDTVARCIVLNCGKFYHPRCISTPEHAVLTSDHMETLAFVCPQHFCAARAENKCVVPPEREESLIPCRRCPKAYHQECIPKKLWNFGRGKSRGKRVWISEADAKPSKNGSKNFDPVDRSLIYCEEHFIAKNRENPELSAPLFNKALANNWRRHYSKLFDDLPSSGEWLANNPRLHSGDADAMEEEEEPHIGSSVPRGSPGIGMGKSRESSRAKKSSEPVTAPPVPKQRKKKKVQRPKELPPNSSISSSQRASQGGAVGGVAVKLEQMAGRGSGVGKVDPIQASAAQQAVKDRLDLLYRVFKLFAEKSKQDAGYTTLTRGSLEKIFDCLVDTYGFSDKSVFVDLGAGIGRVLWHASFALSILERPVGIEICHSLEAESQEFEKMVRDCLQEATGAMRDWEPCTPDISFQEFSSFTAHDYATHIFIFWDGFTKDSKRAAAQIFRNSPLAQVLVLVQSKEAQDPTVTLDFGDSIKMVESINEGIQVEGSNARRAVYIYQRMQANGS